MFDAFIDGLLVLFSVKPMMFLLIGCFVGFWVGILPGLGGVTTLALMLPFIYKMSAVEALPFLMGMHSVVQTTGDITSVLFGIPGEATTVATIIDGHPMAKNGEAGRALGAALMSSLVGAAFGALFLAGAIPIVRPLVLAFGSPEMLMLIVLGLACIASLSGQGARGIMTGVTMGLFGFILSMVGQDPQKGILRFTFDILYLQDGIPLVPAVIGLFALPEIIDLTVRGTSISGDRPPENLGGGALQGCKDTFIHFWLVMRCSLIGAVIGLLPGLGGGVSQWIAYAHAVQSSKTKEERDMFGKGIVQGVLGPGSSNNSKEGAALVTTLGFGVPTTTSMAVLMGALMMLGLQPGPEMLSKNLTLTYSLVWIIVIANVIVTTASFLFLNQLARMTNIRGNLIIPFILMLCFIGAFSTNESLYDLLTVLIFGVLGFLMVGNKFPRPPFILGFILGHRFENYLFISTSRFGAEWLWRPWVLVLICLVLAVAFYPAFKARQLEKQEVDLDEV